MTLNYDGLDDNVVGTADLQKNQQGVDTSNSILSKDSYSVTIENLPVKLVGKYNFVFNYYYKNPDDTQTTPVLGPPSATYSIELTIPDLSEAPTNVVAVGGVSSYTVSWDKPTFKTYGDTIVYESDTNSFNSSSKVVFVGTDNQCSVITSDYNNKWVYVVHRDIFREAHKKGTVAGPITIKTADPDTTFTVANPGSTSASASIDPKDLSGFSLVSNITWVQSTDTKTAGYAIRWSTDDPGSVANPLWEYASVSGRSTTSFTATGLIPNTTYYYQVASTTPYDVVNWTGAASGTFTASDADGTAAGALARLKSYIAIGGATQDLFKIGTGISQSINLNTDPIVTPTLTPGTYHGIVLNKSTTNVGNNFWLTTGQFRVGNPTEFMYWNGTNLYLTGNINATGGKFTGNVQLAIPAGATTSGTLYAGSSPTTGARVRFNSEGIFGYDADGETFKLQSSDGLMTAAKGQIAGWTLDGTKLTKNNARLDSTGVIELGASNTENIIRLDANDATYRLWIGRNSSTTAPFRVTKEGALIASGATINGDSTFNGTITVTSTLSDGTSLQTIKNGAAQGAVVASDLTALTTRVTTAENNITTKASAQSVSDLTTVVGTKAATQFVNEQLALKASLAALDDKLDENAYTVLDVANKINAIDTNVVTISGGKLTAGSVNTLQIATGAITAIKVNAGAITTEKLDAGAVTAEKILSRTITADRINVAEITAYEIAGRTITALEIDTNTITADEIAVGSITVDRLSAGTLTGFTIRTSSGSERVELNSSTGSLRVINGGIVYGHLASAAGTGMLMHYGSTYNPDATTGLVKLQSNYVMVAGRSDNYIELSGGSTTGSIYLRGGAGGITANMNSLASGAANMRYTSGQIYYVTSTRDSKTNIQDIEFTDNQIKSLRPRKFQGLEDIKWGIERYGLGLIAEEIEEIEGLDILLDREKDGKLVGVNYDRLPVLLIDVIKRILNRLDALES